MSYRRRIQKQRQLERQRGEEASARRQQFRNITLGIGGAIAVIAVVAGGFIFLTGGSAEEPTASVAVTMGDNFFDPATVNLKAGEKTRISLINGGRATHNLWSSGPDAESGNGDDIRSDDLAGGEIDSVDVQFDQPGEYGFSCTFHAGQNGRFLVAP
jgi:plastocyanin